MKARWGMNWWLPLLFIGTSAMFIQGQAFYKVWGLKYTMTGDLVESLEFLGIRVTKAWEYNIQQSVTQLWEEGAKKRNPDMFFDAILLFTLSAVVPHVKLALSMALWYMPNIAPSTRVFRFLMLDHLGRWNHYDIIVVALFVCMTKIDLDIMGELTFEVYTYTLKGAYMYCMAVVLSQLIGHLLVHEARRSPSSLPNTFQVFDLPGSNRHKYTIREEIRALYGPNTTVPVYLALIFNTLLYVYAVTGTSYECLINLIGMDIPRTHFSMVDIILYLMHSPTKTELDKYGVVFIGGLVMLFVLVAPVVRLITQIVLWTFPFTKHQHGWLELVHEVSCLWSCLDVSLFAGLLVITETKVLTQLMLKCPKGFGDDCFFVDVRAKHAFYGTFFSVFFSYGMNTLFNLMISKCRKGVESASARKPILDDGDLPSSMTAGYGAGAFASPMTSYL